MKIKYMKIETIPNYYIHITPDSGKELVNINEEPQIRTKEIYVPLNADYSKRIEEDIQSI